ncbi:MAG: hypothetical protein AB7D37_00785 [Desulfovibrio sp.]
MKGLILLLSDFLKKHWMLISLGLIFLSFIFLLIFYVSVNVKVGVIAFIGAVAVAIYNHNKNMERERVSRLFPEKKDAYERIFDLIFGIVYESKIGKKTDEKGNLKKVIDLKKKLMVWGSAEAIDFFNKLEIVSTMQGEEFGVILHYDSLIKILRKDLGHDDSKLKPGDLVALVLTSEDKKRLFAASIQPN